MMRTLATSALLACLVALALVSAAAVITVDDDGGGDYTTIQAGLDAASGGDTVLVRPGTYTDVVDDCDWYWYGTCACIRQSVTLKSSDGPDVTTIDGDGMAMYGVVAPLWAHVVIDGFTITGGWGDAVVMVEGEVRNNVITGYTTGIISDPFYYPASDGGPATGRTPGIVIEGNRIDGCSTGIRLHPTTTNGAEVTGNVITGCGHAGIASHSIRDVAFVGNEISGNAIGVKITNPSHTVGAQFSIGMFSNTIVNNTDANVEVLLGDVAPGSGCEMTIGGSEENANDIYGSAPNLRVFFRDYDVSVDATYNYWGSIACTTFVPLFDIDQGVPDTAFVFEPFFDESHVVTYDCEGVPVEENSWGSIKALFR